MIKQLQDIKYHDSMFFYNNLSSIWFMFMIDYGCLLQCLWLTTFRELGNSIMLSEFSLYIILFDMRLFPLFICSFMLRSTI